jgi:O-antigen ligase
LTSLQLAAAVVIADGVMVLGLVMAGSRAGIALLPLVLIFQYLIMQPGARIHWGKAGASALVAAGLSAAAYFALRDNRAIAAIIGRFDFTGEFRPELWRDSLYALGRFWPVGSGQGTFVPVIMAAERLEVVDPTLPNRAHNDYLEFVLEAGLPGAMVLAVLSVIVLYLAWRALRHPPAGSRTQTLFALGTLAVLGLHSLVDYPLRSMALAAVVATAVGLLIPPRQSEPNSSNKRSQQ